MAGPEYDDMRRVMRHLYDACRRHWLPIGAAPNIEVSLVVNPDDAAILADPRIAHVRVRGCVDASSGVAAQPIFRRRMRTRRASK